MSEINLEIRNLNRRPPNTDDERRILKRLLQEQMNKRGVASAIRMAQWVLELDCDEGEYHATLEPRFNYYR